MFHKINYGDVVLQRRMSNVIQNPKKMPGRNVYGQMLEAHQRQQGICFLRIYGQKKNCI